jgi:hypothetical protein
MKSILLPNGGTYYAQEHNAIRDDAQGAALLTAHQQFGALALATAPTNGQTVTFTINGIAVTFNATTGTPTNPGDVYVPNTNPAVGFAANLWNALINPTVSTATYIAVAAANAQLIQYLGWGLPTGGTTITPYSLNRTIAAPLTSFTASTTVTGGTWTAQQMQLYVEAGTYYIGATQVKFLGGSTPTVTAPVSHPRIDLLTINSSGALAWVTGTENVSPVPPTYPFGKVPLCEIYNIVGETALYDYSYQQSGQGYIQADVRPLTSINALPPGSNNGVGTVSSATTQTIAHGLGRTPVLLDLIASASGASALSGISTGSYNGTTANQITGAGVTGFSGIAFVTSGSNIMSCTVTWDATNFYLTWSVYSGSAFTVNYLWKIF